MKIDSERFTEQQVTNQLSLPQDTIDERQQQIGIIKGLSTINELQRIQMRLNGYIFDEFINQWVQVRRPIMNKLGIGNLLSSLQSMGDVVNFSNYDDKEIPKLALLFFEDNYPTYVIYAEEFGLSPKDFNVISSILKFYPLSVLKNAKNAGHRNVVRGTLSENLLQRAFGANQEKEKGGFFSFLKRK